MSCFDKDVDISLLVSEAIKTQNGEMQKHLAGYKTILRALAAHDIKVAYYNFMPILVWTRIELLTQQPNGGVALLFDLVDFAVFNLHILESSTGVDHYSDAVSAAAYVRFLQNV